MPVFGMRPVNLLETIFDEVLIAVAVVDLNHKLAYANSQALEILGISKTSFDGPVSIEELSRDRHVFDSRGNEIPPEELPVLRGLAGEDIAPRNVKLVLPDGSFKWIHVAIHRFSILGINGVLMVASDETREIELQRVAARLQKLEVLGKLAGALAHNFNNMLSMISFSAFACLQNQDIGPEVRTRLQQITDASLKASNLTKRLAQFSRSQHLKRRPVSVNQLIQHAVGLIEPVLGSSIRLTTELRPNLPEVDVDPLETEQVLYNLMLNARDAMPKGGQLTVTTDLCDLPSDLATRGRANKECVMITVADTGSGIPESVLEHLFEPFFTTKPTGTGLGLASTQGIVRQHGGDITVRSRVGVGTEFTIYLPASHRKQSSGAGSGNEEQCA